MPVILFTFAGRQPNLELQLPMVRRILAEHPNVHYHVWNFARTNSDRAYVKTIEGERITVWNGAGRDGFASPIPTAVDGARQFGASEHNAAYRHYSQAEFQQHLFVKIDDDIVFLETARFGKFVEAIDKHRGAALVANIINNGACTPVNPVIWERFNKMGVPLLDIHLSSKFADMVHRYMFEHHDEVLDQPIELIPTEDWLSINAVGYDWATLRHVLNVIGTPHPQYLAGRPMQAWGRVFGDEGVFQTLPRIIVKGFTAAHLTFGPQDPGEATLARWRENYRALGQRYLDAAHDQVPAGLPDISETSCGYAGVQDTQLHWRSRWASSDNDPRVGRFTP